MRPTRRTAQGDERGTITLFVVTLAIGLLLVVGLVVDGGGKVRSLQRANTAADEAARAGGQAIVEPIAAKGDGARLDLIAARSAAQQYLSAAGIAGQVSLIDGTRLKVTTTATYKPVFLGLMGVDTITTSGESTVRLAQGVQGENP